MFPSGPTNITTPTNALKQSDSLRRCRLCSGTTPFFRRLSRASCSGSCRSDLPLSAVTVGPGTVVVYASLAAATTLGNGTCLRRQAGSALVRGGLALLRRGQPTGALSQEEGGPSAAQRQRRAKSPSPSPVSSYMTNKNHTRPDVDTRGNVVRSQIIRV